MFFIVTTGRSGSTSLARILNQHPLCQCHHERRPILIKLAAEWQHGKLDSDEVRRYMAFKGHRMFPHRVNGQLYGESDQRLSFLIPFLAEFGVSTKFIWLIRDGRDVVGSMFSRNEYSEEEAEQVPHLWAKYRLSGACTGDVERETWNTLTPFEKCCWYWSYTNRVIGTDLSEIDEQQWIMVRLEELASSVDRILQVLGLPYYPLQNIHVNKNYTRSHRYKVWTNEQIEAFDKWCGREMDIWYPGWREGREFSSEAGEEPESKKAQVMRSVLSHAEWASRKTIGRLVSMSRRAVDGSEQEN